MVLLNKWLLIGAAFVIATGLTMLVASRSGELKAGVFINGQRVPMMDIRFNTDGTFTIPRDYPVVDAGEKVVITTMDEKDLREQLYIHWGWKTTVESDGSVTRVGSRQSDRNGEPFFNVVTRLWHDSGFDWQSIYGLFTAKPLGDGRYEIVTTYNPDKLVPDVYDETTPYQDLKPVGDFSRTIEYHNLSAGVYIQPEIGAVDQGVIIVVQ